MWEKVKAFFKALIEIKPDPYFHIAGLMELEGYSDLEIELEIAAMKAAELKKLKGTLEQ